MTEEKKNKTKKDEKKLQSAIGILVNLLQDSSRKKKKKNLKKRTPLFLGRLKHSKGTCH